MQRYSRVSTTERRRCGLTLRYTAGGVKAYMGWQDKGVCDISLAMLAEHGDGVQLILLPPRHFAHAATIMTDPDLAEALPGAVEVALTGAPRESIARVALDRNGLIVLAPSMREAIEVANRRAPAHVQISAEGAERVGGAIRNAGAIFLGDSTPEPVGDYVAGPSHVLPTGGTARYASPLGVYDFVKRTSIIRYAGSRLAADADSIIALAESEGLFGHAHAIRLRVGGDQRTRGGG